MQDITGTLDDEENLLAFVRNTSDARAEVEAFSQPTKKPPNDYLQQVMEDLMQSCCLCDAKKPLRVHDILGGIIGICFDCDKDCFRSAKDVQAAKSGSGCQMCGAQSLGLLSTKSCVDAHTWCRECARHWFVKFPLHLRTPPCFICAPKEVPSDKLLVRPCRVLRLHSLDTELKRICSRYAEIPDVSWETLNTLPKYGNGEPALQPFQMRAVNKMVDSLRNGQGHVCALEMGLGKTRIANTFIMHLLKHCPELPVLIISMLHY